jgi:photosystem II stability/assembly factor-like uncharacterized protein
LHDVQFPDSSTGYAVGNSGAVLKTIDHGVTWKQIPGPTLQSIQAVRFFSAESGFIAGGGGVFKTVNAGSTWIRVIEGGTFESISVPDKKTVYGMRSDGIFKTIDGGETWTELLSVGSGRFTAVRFLDAQTGIVVGFNSLIKKTIDGGNNWISLSPGTNKIINGLHFHDANNGYVIGEVFLRTRDGGATWQPCIQGAPPYLQSIHFPDTQNGFALGAYGEFFKTSDGGETWARSSLDVFPGLTINHRFLNSKRGFVMGAGSYEESTIYYTSDGGETWAQLNIPMKFMPVSVRRDLWRNEFRRGSFPATRILDFQGKKFLLNGRSLQIKR